MNDAARISIVTILEQYGKFIDDCASHNVHARATALQEQKLAEIPPRIAQMKGYKAQAIARQDEGQANLFFHFQCMLRSMESSLQVWLAVKDGKPEKGWTHLVDAQEYKDVALLTHDVEGVRAHERQLLAMEHALFPHAPLFNSAGFVESIGNCSICAAPFSTCDHIENFVYMGRLCRRVNRKFIEATHAALVKNPRDRRCVITKSSNDAGRMIDRFTLEDVGPKTSDGGDAMMIEAILMTFVELDLD